MIGNKLTPFKFWCQKILPTVYDDSMSYYEYLCKLNEYLNEVIEQINTLTQAEEDFQTDLSQQWEDYKSGLNDDWLEYKTGLTDEWNTYQRELTEAWLETKGYIDHYFDNLNVQTEINNKLDAMVLDGTMGNLIDAVISDDIPTTVTSWLTAHVDPVGSAVVVDNTLTITGAAADAKIVGDKLKDAVSSTGISIYHNHLEGYTSADELPLNSIIGVSGSTLSSEFTDLPVYHVDLQILTFAYKSDVRYGAIQVAYTLTGISYVRFSAYSATAPDNYTWLDWQMVHAEGGKTDTITFVSQVSIDTVIYLESGHTYGIYCDGFDEGVGLYIHGYNGDAVYTIDYNYVEFTPQHTGLLTVYNFNGTLGKLKISVYEGEEKNVFEDTEYEYRIGTNGDYTGFVEALVALKRNNFKKKLIIDGGVYDLVQEYADNNIPICPDNVDPVGNYLPYNPIVPPNTHIIGKGNVILEYLGNASNMTYNQAYAISVLNVLGNCIIENITLHGKNCRYCLHDDCLSLAEYNKSTHIYKNVKIIKEIGENGSDSRYRGTHFATGFGFNPYITYRFEDSEIINKDTGGTFYGHNRGGVGVTNSVYNSAVIELNDTILEKADNANNCVYLDNIVSGVSPSQRITTKFRNCIINGAIMVSDNNGTQTGNNPNVFDITLQNSSDVTVDIKDLNNTYTVKTYNI